MRKMGGRGDGNERLFPLVSHEGLSIIEFAPAASLMTTHLERLRHAELHRIRSWFPPGARVLEIGGGSGYQAAILDSWGCHVQSIDLDPDTNPAMRYFSRQHFPVQTYDGKTFPFRDGSFDVVFSSNMLYHVVPLAPFLNEMRRVLAPGGRMIHVVPTASWRIWTNLAHYVFYGLALVRKCMPGRAARGPAETEQGPASAPAPAQTGRLRRLLLAPPLGPAPSSLSEIGLFRRAYWTRQFRAGGLRITGCVPAGLFHTGYILMPDLSLEARGWLARLLGSSCTVFVVEPEVTEPEVDAVRENAAG